MSCAKQRRRELQDEAAGLFGTKQGRSFDNEEDIDALVCETESTDQNRLSPLLRLPAEIRNQIYSLILGNNSLHVYARKTADGEKKAKVDYYTCAVPHTHDYQDSGPQNPEWLKQHMPCFTNGSAHLTNIALMFTCRQIFTETRLLPYSTNEFTFVAPSSLQTYVESVLSPEQAKALRTLSIWTSVAPGTPITTSTDSTDTTTTWNSWIPTPNIANGGLLNGIQDLRLSISVFASEAGEGEWRDMREIQGLFWFMKLARLKKVSVAVGQDEDSGIVDERGVIRAYAGEVRRRILGIHVPRTIVDEEE